MKRSEDALSQVTVNTPLVGPLAESEARILSFFILSPDSCLLLGGTRRLSTSQDQRLAGQNETMETNETNEMVFYCLWNQIVKWPKCAPTSKKSKKCDISPHWRVRDIKEGKST